MWPNIRAALVYIWTRQGHVSEFSFLPSRERKVQGLKSRSMHVLRVYEEDRARYRLFTPLSFHTHHHTHTQRLPIAQQHNSHPLNDYPSVRCEMCSCVPPLLTHLNPVSSRKARHERRRAEERRGCTREVTEECDTKGHPLSAAHSIAARPP